MNYTKLYDAVIAKAVFRKKPEGYCEKHHIVPRCMGGANGKDNLVYLTAKEHFICHKFLVRMYPSVRGNWYALIAMGRLPEFKAKVFASERAKAASARKGFKYSDESKVKMSFSAKRRGSQVNSVATRFGNKPPWNKGLKNWRQGYVHSDETRDKISSGNIRAGNIPPWVRKQQESAQ